MANVNLSDVLVTEQPRRKIVTLTASNAALAIPSWAQGGKGVVYVTGCGGGGSGSVDVSLTRPGAHGGAAGWCRNHMVQIPVAISALAVVIGTGGAAVAATVDTPGINGGNTSLTIGSLVLTLSGGGGALTTVAGAGGGAAYAAFAAGTSQPISAPFTRNSDVTGYAGPASTLVVGATGNTGNIFGIGMGGGQSLFGAGGAAPLVAPVALTNGNNATGYGAGGSGATDYGSASNATSGSGSPGLLILEFVEGY